ncbi:MAG: S49 family peptidase, partial [Nocardiopsis sp. BM-2018]
MVDLAKITEPLSLNRFGPRPRGPLVLELDLTEGVADESPGDPLSQIMNRRKQQYLEVLEGIRRGARDPEVGALIVRVDARALGIAKIQELRDTVADFRATGRTAVAWADTYGEAGDGNLPYYLATAFSRIAVSPTGLVALSGLMSRATFIKGALDKLDVKFDAGARHEYKNAINQYTQTEYTPAHREAIGRIVQSMNDQIVTAVAKSRDLTEERVRELIDTAPILAQEALDAGLVDQLAYRDEVYAELTKEVRDKGENSREPSLL